MTGDAADGLVSTLVGDIRWTHEIFLETVEGLDEATFHRRAAPTAPSIAFHLWHTARWADAFAARLGTLAPALARLGAPEQIWDAGDLAAAWNLGAALGKDATGEGLDDDASASLPLPAKAVVVGYSAEAFAAAEHAFAEIRDEELLGPSGDFYDEGGWTVLHHFGWHLSHAGRHLGMIEALKGVLGMHGTATV